MDYWLWSLFLRPLAAFFLLACVALPIRMLIARKMRPGWLKHILLRRIAGKSDAFTR